MAAKNKASGKKSTNPNLRERIRGVLKKGVETARSLEKRAGTSGLTGIKGESETMRTIKEFKQGGADNKSTAGSESRDTTSATNTSKRDTAKRASGGGASKRSTSTTSSKRAGGGSASKRGSTGTKRGGAQKREVAGKADTTTKRDTAAKGRTKRPTRTETARSAKKSTGRTSPRKASGGNQLEDKNFRELYKQAKAMDLPGRSRMSKAELVKAIKRVG